MSTPLPHEVTRAPLARLSRSLGMVGALAFLLVNLAVRAYALHARGPGIWDVFLAGGVLGALLCLFRPLWLKPALVLFGASFFLYGFHSYRPQSQAFEWLVTLFAIVLLIRVARGHAAAPTPPATPLILPLFILYALTATFSLLLLPPGVLEHRVFLEDRRIGQAVLEAFPKDPLYPIASVNRLWLFLGFGFLLSAQLGSRELYRGLFRGIAWAAILGVVLGLLDFAGVLSLARFNLSHLFYGAGYRRLQSTFGNPSWFACFVACTLPFLLLEFSEGRKSLRLLLAAAFPLCAAGLFLSGARASWLAGCVLLVALGALTTAARSNRSPLHRPSPLGWLALGCSLAVFALLAAGAYGRRGSADAGAVGDDAPGRLEGLSREIQIRGLGLNSPRRVAAEYAFELAKQKPLLGLGYESFNLHLRAQLGVPGSAVAGVVNTALASDPQETVFDDAHDTYLQVLTGTGFLGLALWLALGATAFGVTALAVIRPGGETATVWVALAMLLFHFYGLFQGMAYIPIVFFLLPILAGYAMTLEPGPLPAWIRRTRAPLLTGLAALVAVSPFGYAADRGYRSVKRTLGRDAYLPDEAAEFEGFYRPESGPAGEFRWMPRRGIVNVKRAAPFRLSFTCGHPDLDRTPVLVSLRFEDEDLGSLVCRRPGTQEKRFALGSPGSLRISVSRTFRPSGADSRELGVAVSAIRWE